MSEKDKQLIAKAQAMPFYQWDLISNLKEQCESEEAKEIIHRIMVSNYHREEAYNHYD